MIRDPFGPVRRQYVFRSRRCRQRTAQRLGAGVPLEAVAAVERVPAAEIEALQGDPGFAELVLHYRAQAALPPDRRLAALAELAMAMLERLVATGDLRAITFVLHETARGRDPARRLAEAAVAAATPPETAPPAPCPAPSPAFAGAGRGEGSSTNRGLVAPTGPFAFCAATQPDEAAARLLAEQELARVEQRLAAAVRGLRRELTAEAERIGTVAHRRAPDLPAAARRLASAAFAAPEAGFRAAAALDACRRHLAAGGLPHDPTVGGHDTS